MKIPMQRSPLVLAFAVFASIIFADLASTAPPSGEAGGNKDAHRIVSLAPSVTEILYALGLHDRVAGVTRYCVYPPEAKQKPNVGGYINPSLEAIRSLDPDVVFLLSEHADLVLSLQKLHIRIVQLDHNSINGILASIHTIAEIGGDPAAGDRLAAGIESRLSQLRLSHAGQRRPRVLMGFDRTSGSGRLEMMVPGKGTIFADLLETAGGDNAAGGERYRILSTEGILRLDPDVVILLAGESDGMPKRREATLDTWKNLVSLRAAQQNRVFMVSGSELVVPGPRLLLLGERFANILDGKEHP